MATQLTATQLRKELFTTLDYVIYTGETLEIKRPNGTVCIVAAVPKKRLDNRYLFLNHCSTLLTKR